MIDRSDLLTWQGLKALADVVLHSDYDPPFRVRVAPIRRGDVVFCSREWRAPWRAAWVRNITEPCVLVTAFHDRFIRAHPMGEVFATPVHHWFGVQVADTHPQMTAMPIGVDGRKVPLLQAAERRETRDVLLYVNFSLGNRWPHAVHERLAVLRALAGQAWVTREQDVSPAHYFAMLGRSQFVASPMGNGWDCYRTYEAIAMGAIPIVRRFRPVSDVCEDLPVLMVDDWSEVTQERLEYEWNNRYGFQWDTRTLTLSYWRERIQEMANQLK